MALLLTEAEVRELFTHKELIDAMERALAAFSDGHVTQPVRTALQVGPGRNYFGVMPAYVPAHDSMPAALGVKLVSAFDENTARGLPTHLATIILLNPHTGAVEAVMDGRYITEARTAAVSAVAVRRLAREDAKTLAILGSGVQARSHAELLTAVREFREIRAWSPTPGSLQRFVSDVASATGIPARAATSSEEAVRGAEVVVLATSSAEPVLRSEWVNAGALVIAVGACRPHMREMDPELTARARVIVDSRAAALVEAGDIVLGIREGRWPETHIAGELGEVVLGRVAARTAVAEVVVFKSLGMAVEDVAAAQLAYERAKGKGKGREISI